MSVYRIRKTVNIAGTTAAILCVCVAIIPLGAMLYYVLAQGGSSLSLSFFTSLPKASGENGGVFNSIVGTLELILIASCIGIPIGIMSGIYLSLSKHIRFSNVVRFFTDVVAGTPSIVAGVVAYALVVLPMGHYSAIAGGVALALLMFPTVTRATEAALRLVPESIREAGLAIGLPEWKTMFNIVLPSATAGIVTAIMLGVARVSGETAPLLFTALGSQLLSMNPNQAIDSLPTRIWLNAQQPYHDLQNQAWAGAFTLFAIVVILNLMARLLTRRLTARVGGN